MSDFEPGQEHAGEGRALVSGAETPIAQAARSPFGSPGYPSYGVPGQGDEVPLAVTLRQYLYMVVKRKWLILSVALAFTVLGSVRTLMQTPLYMATVRIQIEREAAKVVEGGSTNPVEAGSTDFLRTQYELLKSRGMAERVVSAQRLAEDTSFLKPRDLSLLGIFDRFRGERPPIGSSPPLPGSRYCAQKYDYFAGSGIAARRCFLRRSEPGACSEYCQWLCRRLHRVRISISGLRPMPTPKGFSTTRSSS